MGDDFATDWDLEACYPTANPTNLKVNTLEKLVNLPVSLPGVKKKSLSKKKDVSKLADPARSPAGGGASAHAAAKKKKQAEAHVSQQGTDDQHVRENPGSFKRKALGTNEAPGQQGQDAQAAQQPRQRGVSLGAQPEACPKIDFEGTTLLREGPRKKNKKEKAALEARTAEVSAQKQRSLQNGGGLLQDAKKRFAGGERHSTSSNLLPAHERGALDAEMPSTSSKRRKEERQQQQQQQQQQHEADPQASAPGGQARKEKAKKMDRAEQLQAAVKKDRATTSKGTKQKNFEDGMQEKGKQQQEQAASVDKKGGRGSLFDKMRARLSGGRFRSLNEQLYTCKGEEALQLMQTDPSLFNQYHDGFQQQTESWPVQPIDQAVKFLDAKAPTLAVADFGCGDGKLAQRVKQRTHSFDLVSSAPHVIACNMAHVPLDNASIDVAVFSLALMGTDYGLFLLEAARVLRHKGWLWIAEVRSRFTERPGEEQDVGKASSRHLQPFLKCLAHLGFSLQSLDASNKMFVVMVLRKLNVPTVNPAAIVWPSLRACMYKKR